MGLILSLSKDGAHMTRPARRPERPASWNVIIHSLDEALAAAEAASASARRLRLISARGAALSAGPGWFNAVIEAIRERYPGAVVESVLDCGASPGAVMAALRLASSGGSAIDALAVRVRPVTRAKLAAMAKSLGVTLYTNPPGPALDLLDAADPAGACAAWLKRGKRRA